MCASVARSELSASKTRWFTPILPQQRAQPQAARCGAPPPDRNGTAVLPALPPLVSAQRPTDSEVDARFQRSTHGFREFSAASHFADPEIDARFQPQDLRNEFGRSEKGQSFEQAARSTMPALKTLRGPSEEQKSRFRHRRRNSGLMRTSWAGSSKWDEGDDSVPASKFYNMSCSEWRSGKRSPGPKRNKVKDFTLQSDSGEEGHSWADQQSPNVDNVAEMAMADRNYPKLMKPSEYIYEQVQLRLKVDAPVKLPELAILRGDNLDLSSKEEEEQLELARHRRETGHRAAQDQRQMARKRGIHRMRHEQAMRLLTKSNLLNERHERRKMHRKNQRRFETPEPLEEEEEEDAEYSLHFQRC